MKIFFAAALSLVLSVQLFGQRQLDFIGLNNETVFKVIPYADGSFSLFTSGKAVPSEHFSGRFKTYDSQGDLIVDKPLVNKMQFGMELKSFCEFEVPVPYYLYNPIDQKTVLIGFLKNKFVCRVLSSSGDIKEILIPKKAIGERLDQLVACGLDERGNVYVIAQGTKISKNPVVWLNIDIQTGEYKLRKLNDQLSYTAYGSLKTIGHNFEGLFIMADDQKVDSKSQVLKIDHNGEIKKWDIALPVTHIRWLVTEELFNLTVGEKDEFYFSMRIEGSLNFVICKINNGELQTVFSWTVAEELYRTQREKHHMIEQFYWEMRYPLLSLYHVDNKDFLIYSYKGRDITFFPLDMEQEEIGSYNPENHFDIEADNPLDMVPFIQANQSFLDSVKTISEKDLHLIRTIYRTDGTFGFLTISGDKVERKQHYQNIKITKY